MLKAEAALDAEVAAGDVDLAGGMSPGRTLRASLSQPVLAVHVSPTEEEAERFQRSWQAWGDHPPPEVLVSPYRATVAPLANYISALHRQRPDVTLTLVVPEIVVARPWQRIRHNRIAARPRASLIAYEGIIITTVPFHLPQ